MTADNEPKEANEISDADLEAAAGGQADNSTELIYANTYIPFDSSF